jgi:hypothetical protein
MTTKSPSFKDDGPAKKPYERPRLEVYGDIREVTDTLDRAGVADSGHGTSMNKT